MKLFSNQILTGEPAWHPQQRGGASHGPPSPAGPGWHQSGDHRRRQHPAADHRGQLTETMISTMTKPNGFLLAKIDMFFLYSYAKFGLIEIYLT